MNRVNNNPITKVKKRRPDIAIKRAENKYRLVYECMNMIKNDIFGYEDFLFDLARESLYKRTQKELKEILYGE